MNSICKRARENEPANSGKLFNGMRERLSSSCVSCVFFECNTFTHLRVTSGEWWCSYPITCKCYAQKPIMQRRRTLLPVCAPLPPSSSYSYSGQSIYGQRSFKSNQLNNHLNTKMVFLCVQIAVSRRFVLRCSTSAPIFLRIERWVKSSI